MNYDQEKDVGRSMALTWAMVRRPFGTLRHRLKRRLINVLNGPFGTLR